MRRFYKYKVEFLPIEEEQGEKKIDKERIEEILNRYAENGWRLRQIDLCGNFGLICVFEKSV
jgi:SOS response regulatory protein OraA/RecX